MVNHGFILVVAHKLVFIQNMVKRKSSCSYVISPYNEFPQLLGSLLKLLNGELAWSTRREVLKVNNYEVQEVGDKVSSLYFSVMIDFFFLPRSLG